MRRHEMMSASLIFRVNCSEASFFTIRFFHFQVHFPSKRELFFELNKETSCEIDKARKYEYKQDESFVSEVFDLHRLSSRALKSIIIMSNLCEINESLQRIFEEYLQ